jgi:hypothetical protein
MPERLEAPRDVQRKPPEDPVLSSFLSDHGVLVALVCAGCALVYGALTVRSLLALSPGNE